jgi:hypothetical protein
MKIGWTEQEREVLRKRGYALLADKPLKDHRRVKREIARGQKEFRRRERSINVRISAHNA